MIKERIKEKIGDFKPPMRTLPVKRGPVRGKIRGRVGRGLSLGGGQEIVGLDAPPATSYVPPAHHLQKVSMLSGVSR